MMKKNILILDTGKEWGGGTNSLIELLKRIDKINYSFTALFYYNYKKGADSDIKTEIEKLGVKFLILEQRRQSFIIKLIKEFLRLIFFFNRRLQRYFIFFIDYHSKIKQNAQRISELLKNLRIDLIYMNNQPSSNLEGIIASKITGIPALQHSRIYVVLNPFEVKAINMWLKRMICVSEGVKYAFVEQGVDPKKCTVVYNGINAETKPLIDSQEIRKKYGISEDVILIGTVCSIIKRKRLNDLIEAMSIVINKTTYPVKCLIIGEGPERKKITDLSKKKNLHDKVIFTGFQSDAISYINAMNIFVLTSCREGLPRVILEAMLMGKPVIASNVTGPSELVVNGETGFLAPVGDPYVFAEHCLNLIENHRLREQMGEKAKKRVLEKFSIKKYVIDVENIFAEILGQ